MNSPVAAETTAFFYGSPVPPELTTVYDQVVVEPGHHHDVATLSKGHAVVVAYFSIGEVAKHKLPETDSAWRLVQNEAWASTVMDLSHPGYRDYVIAQYEKLWQAGYRRFFLDTLDSYQLGAKQPEARERQRRALCALISAMAARHPEARWLLNRGFELLPDIAKLVHGVVAESLFDRWDAAHNSYVRVPKADHDWLLVRLREVKERYGLPVIVIDYRPASEREQARATAKKIAALGFEPWVCNSAINELGVGSVEIMPRRVVIVTDKPHAAASPGTARSLAPVLEYLGYVPEYRDLETGLPEQALGPYCAGVVSVLPPGAVFQGYERWLTRQILAGVRVAVFGGLGVAADGELARALGIRPLPAAEPGRGQVAPAAIVARDALIGFEAEPPARGPEGLAVIVEGRGVIPHLTLRTGQGELATAVATTRYGGLALSHVFALRGLSGERAWVLDPFAFLRRALRLPDIPVPDITTEGGRRVALLAIDGQGLADSARMRGRPRVAHVLATQILAKYPWPHALDLREPQATSAERAQDERAARPLLQTGALYAAEIPLEPSARGVPRSLTELAPLWSADDARITLPIAQDFAFIGSVSEAYPLRRVLQAWSRTGTPRRLRPLALHYHAFVLSSPGGLEAVRALYDSLAEQGVHALRLEEYFARVRAFREQVITRAVDGSYKVFGGEALRTLRVPASLGVPQLAQSAAVDSADAAGAHYVTFEPGALRLLRLSRRPAASPQLGERGGASGARCTRLASSGSPSCRSPLRAAAVRASVGVAAIARRARATRVGARLLGCLGRSQESA